MEAVELKVDGMTCGSCVKAAERALTAVPGVDGAEVRLETGTATVRGDNLRDGVQSLLAALVAAGYPARISGTTAPTAVEPRRSGCGSSARSTGGGCCCGR